MLFSHLQAVMPLTRFRTASLGVTAFLLIVDLAMFITFHYLITVQVSRWPCTAGADSVPQGRLLWLGQAVAYTGAEMVNTLALHTDESCCKS
jgi:hypothetical protein